MNNASQIYQVKCGFLQILTTEVKKKKKFNKTKNVYIASQKGVRLDGIFVTKNVINLSRENLSASEVSLLSKVLKFAPIANKIDFAMLKAGLEEYGWKLRIMWHFRNNEQSFETDRFRPKSSFNGRNKDVIIEANLSCLEERLLDIMIASKSFKHVTKEEWEASYSLKDEPSLIIKGISKGSDAVVCDREDYLKK